MSAAGERSCGACSLCCEVLRVDELAKLGGRRCMHQRPQGGCAVYDRRPGVCRSYRCAWLGGAFGEDDRPDRLGAVLDLQSRGDEIRLVIRQARAGAWDESPRLREIGREMQASMTVEVRDVEDVLDADRPFRVLERGGRELLVRGDLAWVLENDRPVTAYRAAWPVRWSRRLGRRLARFRLSRWPSHEERAAALADPDP